MKRARSPSSPAREAYADYVSSLRAMIDAKEALSAADRTICELWKRVRHISFLVHVDGNRILLLVQMGDSEPTYRLLEELPLDRVIKTWGRLKGRDPVMLSCFVYDSRTGMTRGPPAPLHETGKYVMLHIGGLHVEVLFDATRAPADRVYDISKTLEIARWTDPRGSGSTVEEPTIGPVGETQMPGDVGTDAGQQIESAARITEAIAAFDASVAPYPMYEMQRALINTQ